MALARHQFTVTDEHGEVVGGAKVEVRREVSGQPLAALYSDRAGATLIGNPITLGADGYCGFHVQGGAYQIRAYTGPSGSPTFERIWRYVGIGLAAESDGLGVGVDAIGTFAGRATYDDQVANFIYLSQDGDGASNPDAVLFAKLSSGHANWSAPILIRGIRGGDRYELTNWDSDRPATGEELIGHIATISITFLSAFAGSVAKALVASTATAVYSIQKNGTQIGTLTFSAGNLNGVFAMASPNTFTAGDRFSLVAPNPRDATLSGVSMNIVATR